MYRLILEDPPATIECDSLEALQAAVAANVGKVNTVTVGSSKRKKTKSRKGDLRFGEGPEKSWAEAEAYAKAHGITRNEARSVLSRLKKEAQEEALRLATGHGKKRKRA
jgi:hypothetical protein